MGSGHLGGMVNRSTADNIQARAVCDVYQRRLSRAMATAKCEGDRDYRRILDRKDLDAILIATPDHWHAKIAIDALEDGKHVYVEKPIPDRIYGKHGTIDLGGTPVLRANGEFLDEFKAKNGGQTEAKLEVHPRPDMVGNFLQVMRGQGTLHCNVNLGAATMVAIKLDVESYRQRKTMNWDPKRERLMV
jgi:hypothetical protein